MKKSVDKQSVANILYQTGRTAKAPRAAHLKIIETLQAGGSLLQYQLKPMTNLSLLNHLVKAPSELMVRVRWFELVGYDLMKYNTDTETNLLYELSLKAVSDLLDYHQRNKIPAKDFTIHRSDFAGEVLILKGTEDVVFSDETSRQLTQVYPHSQPLFFKDGHRMRNDTDRYIRIRNAFLQGGFTSAEFKSLLKE